mmetsp:Transcript_15444/g.33382  ORF Transcript_15444/g.33382 Transcript_15444/m.33382 type:complete len:116 (-) Transcript_15444:128-475(-)|eukprot:CAMPEP_0118926508 /NCGR_PEP_ID=MMETSP1169-20130426/4181_1 /TAXON_ID=36882 /ORGANISM="Pyramimonas obovata, Strain CCMP722" /LENGTH=115 /DNA_ID=CAMNT_0006868069 /DNA_START=115 /DNA_END=462 /DNA_ORIENTATION=-
MGRSFSTERQTYAGRKHRDYHNDKRAKAVQNQQWHYFNSGKLSPEEQKKEEERLKKEAKKQAAEEYRKQMEAMYEVAEEEGQEEDKETVEVMFHIASGDATDVESICVALRVMSA